MTWIRHHAVACMFTVVIVFNLALFVGIQKNFNEHKSLDKRDISENCQLLQQRWDLLNETYRVILAPVPHPERFASNPDLYAYILEQNKLRMAKRTELLAKLGPRNPCPSH